MSVSVNFPHTFYSISGMNTTPQQVTVDGVEEDGTAYQDGPEFGSDTILGIVYTSEFGCDDNPEMYIFESENQAIEYKKSYEEYERIREAELRGFEAINKFMD